jgi:hypothetical protein
MVPNINYTQICTLNRSHKHYSFLPQEFFALLTKIQLIGYCLISLILLIITTVTIVMDTPDKKIPKSTQPRVPVENTYTLAAAPAGGWMMIPNLAIPGML